MSRQMSAVTHQLIGSQLALPDPDGDFKTVRDIAIQDGHNFTDKEIEAINKIAEANYRARYGSNASPAKF